MAGINRTPPAGDDYASRIRAYREARRAALKAEGMGQTEIERELDQLDEAVVSASSEELRELRQQLEVEERPPANSKR